MALPIGESGLAMSALLWALAVGIVVSAGALLGAAIAALVAAFRPGR